jgi:hypothetical protein
MPYGITCRMSSLLRLLHDRSALSWLQASQLELAAVRHQDNMLNQLQHVGIRLCTRQTLPFAHEIASTKEVTRFGITGNMTGSELAAAKTEDDMLIRRCPLHMIKLSQMYCSLWHHRQDDRSRAGGRQK